ncbi:hypothetical protein [Cryptosporangium phraense]|uniref:Exo-alpha-sialidase n=1 Tax=Cryptosporangium phraense TaxID=2593070 RepID=A0A545B0D4_9ACTN|nr:hypothetical protein [Cryptosporangium phraense]TQS47014.1 hypothetical protein FL583_01755 [Cryptosporangium phraense]
MEPAAPEAPPSSRRRWGPVAGIAAAAVAVTAAAALFGPEREKPSPEPAPPVTPWSTTSNLVAFADDRNGWALTPRCDDTTCHPRFWRTLDGGTSWGEVPVPDPVLGRDTGVQLIPAGPSTVVVEAGRRRWLSTDAGASWHRGLAVDVLARPAEPPVGVPLRITAGTQVTGGTVAATPRTMGWYEPATGQPTAFPEQLDWQPISWSGARDGSVWVVGGNAQLRVWEDGDWRTLRPAMPAPPRTFIQVAAVDRRTAYLLVFGVDDESLLRPSAISATADGGKTWRLVSLRGSTLRGSRDAAALGTRLVIVDSNGGVRVFDAAARSSAPFAVEEAPALWKLDAAGSRVIGTGMQDGRFYYTVDGEVWTPIRLPS